MNSETPRTAQKAARTLREWLGTLAAITLLGGVATWVLQFSRDRFSTQIAPDPGDPVLVAWLIDWVSGALPRGLEHTLQAPMFFPTQNSLLLADHWLGLGVLLAPVRVWLGGDYPGPFAVYNTLLILSFALGGGAMTWVCRRENASWPASILAGLIYGFAPARLGQLSHLQVLWAPTLPLILWSFGRLLREPTAKRGAAFVLAFAGQFTGGSYLSYMVCVALTAQLAEAARRPESWSLWRRRLPVLAATAFAAALLAIAYFAPYLWRDSERGGRSSHEAAYFGASLVSLVEPAELSWYTRFVMPDGLVRAENQHFPGMLATLLLAAWWILRARKATGEPLRQRLARPGGWQGVVLIVLGVLYAEITTWRVWYGYDYSQLTSEYIFALSVGLAGSWLVWRALRRSGRDSPPSNAGPESNLDRSLFWAGAVCFALAFPLLFVPLRNVLPGLAELRVPARFYLVALVPIALFAARGADLLRRRFAGRGVLVTAGLFALALAELPLVPVRWESVQPVEARATDRWLREARVGALLDLPLDLNTGEDIAFVWRQRLHGRPIVNGYSGYEPAFLARLRQEIGGQGVKQPFKIPDEVILERLAAAGVTHLRFRQRMRLNRRGQVLLSRLVAGGWLTPVGPMGERERIFEIHVPPIPPGPH